MTENNSTNINEIKAQNDLAKSKLDMAQKKATMEQSRKEQTQEKVQTKVEQKIEKHQMSRKEMCNKNKPVGLQQAQEKREKYQERQKDMTKGEQLVL